MTTIKQFIFSEFKKFSIISASMLFSIVLLMVRVKLTHSFLYLFLVWNLFLAVIPLAISTYLLSTPKLSKIIRWLWLGVWLLFLPNAPYIVTDLLHLGNRTQHLLWLDVLVICMFAFNGMMLFYVSLINVKDILKAHIHSKFLNAVIFSICFLSGFGVYLGRFLRYNSWEIVQNPLELITDIINIILYPNQHTQAWLFTLLFGMFLTVGYFCFNHYQKTTVE